MSTDTFETSRTYRSESFEETPPTIRHTTGSHAADAPSGPPVAERLDAMRASAGDALAQALDAARGAWRRFRQRLRGTSIRIPSTPRFNPSLDTSIVVVWSVAVALVAIQVALVVSPVLGIAIALLEGVALGVSGRRLYRLVTRS
jgi:hypothetical protein